MPAIIDDQAIAIRTEWIWKIAAISGDFANDFSILHTTLGEEITHLGTKTLLDHLRLCWNIPESYWHDSSEEKLYSKYTDSLLCYAYEKIGFKSIVIEERADVADVECFSPDYSFVADAKAFRLSRTAKNQKDFKVQAMDRWKHGKPYAMVVCPIYQLPRNTSQIYHQAITRDVCIFTYSHLSLLVQYAEIAGQVAAQHLLWNIFKSVSLLNPSKTALEYRQTINRTILNNSKEIEELRKTEKRASTESVEIAKQEALSFLALKRSKIINMNHQDAIRELIKISNIDNKIKVIESISDNWLFTIS